MQLMRLRDVPAKQNDRIFRYSRARAVVACGAVVAIIVAMLWSGVRQGVVIFDVAALLSTAVILPFRGLAMARFRPSNWLVRVIDGGMYVQLRSYLNSHFSADDLTVAFIPFREIRGAREVRDRREIPELGTRRGVSVQLRRMAELELTCDTTTLTDALAEERARPAPTVARWYGTSSFRFQHEPVMVDGARLLLVWECVPSVRSFLATLTPQVRLEDTRTQTTDYTKISAETRADVERRIAELARSGQTMVAISTARLLLGCSLSEARTRVESLRRGEIPDKPAA